MNNRMMRDYIVENGRATYLPEGRIANIKVARRMISV